MSEQYAALQAALTAALTAHQRTTTDEVLPDFVLGALLAAVVQHVLHNVPPSLLIAAWFDGTLDAQARTICAAQKS